MKHLAYLLTVAISASARADSLFYPNPGTLAPTHTFTAASTGNMTATFIAGSGADNDHIRLTDITSGFVSSWLMPSHETSPGDTFNLGQVTSGDILTFEVENNASSDASQVFSSDPMASTDGYNHFYAQTLSSSADGALVFLGAQDIPLGYWWSGYNYNGEGFTVGNVLATDLTPAPEPAALSLIGTGLLGLTTIRRRRQETSA